MEDFDLRKFLIENKLTTNSRQLEEGYFKSFIAGLLMMTGLSWGQITPENRAKIDLIQKETLSPQEKRAEIKKIMLANQEEIKQKIQQAQASQKPVYGTPEQREAAAKREEQNRKMIFNRYIKGAYHAEGCVEEVSEEEYASGCKSADNEGQSYIKGTSNDLPDYVYRELEDGTKLKIDLKKYGKIINKRSKSAEVGLDGLEDPKFNSGKSCGIAKAGDRANRRDWKKK